MIIDKHRARLDYQRDFMRARRRRLAKAIALAVLTAGQMSAEEILERKSALTKRWVVAKGEWLAENAGRYTSHKDAVASFWARIEQQLDANIAHARRMKG